MRRLAASLILFLAALPCCAQTRVLCASKTSYTDKQGNAWSADTASFTPGTSSGSYTGLTWVPISGTTDQPIYQSQRWGRGMAYTFPLANGTYKVNLYFAETWSGAFANGVRVFNVALNDTVAISNLDVFAKVGAKTADVEIGTVIVSNGSLVISFQPVRENPIINAIEILPVAPAVPPQPDSITVMGELLWCTLCYDPNTVNPDGTVTLGAANHTTDIPATGNLVIAQTGGPSASWSIAPDGTVVAQGTVDMAQDPIELVIFLTDANGASQPGATWKVQIPNWEAKAALLTGTISFGLVRNKRVTGPDGNPAAQFVDTTTVSLR